jgi:hypothetical protein
MGQRDIRHVDMLQTGFADPDTQRPLPALPGHGAQPWLH